MQASVQHPVIQAPSLRVALTVSLLAAVMLVLGFSGMTASRDDVAATPSTTAQQHQSQLSINATFPAVDNDAVKSEQAWRSDVMDSSPSVASLAALKKSGN